MFGDFPLNGKIAVITGAGSGINLAFARNASSQGAKVLIADLRLTTEAEDFVKGAKDVIFTKCDVTKWNDLDNLITVSKKEFGDVPDVYIAGAGVFEPPWSNFWDDNEKERYAEVDINVNHPIKLTRIAMRALLGKDKKGVVLIVASVAGLQGLYSTALYSATKHAMVGFTKSMAAADRLEGVKVVCICPGAVETPLWTDREDKMSQFSFRDMPSNTPEEVAKAMADLVQDGQYDGGTVLEITVAGTRVIPLWNIDPPASGGSSGRGAPQEMMQKAVAPIVDKMKRERGIDL